MVTMSGKQLVLARGLTPTDDGPHQWQVSSTPNGDTVSGAIQVQLISAGPPPTPPDVPLTTDAGTAILTNDNGLSVLIVS
jgi:hypothetical protein